MTNIFLICSLLQKQRKIPDFFEVYNFLTYTLKFGFEFEVNAADKYKKGEKKVPPKNLVERARGRSTNETFN